MKNEKYIAPEMEVIDVKMDAVLMGSGCEGQGADTSNIPPVSHCGHLAAGDWKN